jgi:hypothetical protein
VHAGRGRSTPASPGIPQRWSAIVALGGPALPSIFFWRVILLAELAGWEDVGLMLIGIALIAVEVFVLPGFASDTVSVSLSSPLTSPSISMRVSTIAAARPPLALR